MQDKEVLRFYVHLKLENEFFRKMNKENLANVTELVCPFTFHIIIRKMNAQGEEIKLYTSDCEEFIA